MDKKCGLFALVETFFDIIDSNKNGVNFFISEGEDLNYIIQLYCDHDKEKMKTVKKFLADKREVYFGTFEDQDCSIEELYLCRCKYFISNKDLYFDFEATNSRSRVCVSDKPWLAKAP
ncbi:MAG: hypothetical protein LBF38_05435 [Deltaproteobacteria bacterium]|nr:hypothetical protein [Deltaproteobacteria bacterium]